MRLIPLLLLAAYPAEARLFRAPARAAAPAAPTPAVVALPAPAAAAPSVEKQAADARGLFDSGAAAPAVVLVHGLNSAPAKMADLQASLEGGGARVVRVVLAGHDGKGWGGASRRRWLSQIEQAHIAATERARGGPVHLVAHSMGGLLGLDWQASRGAPAFARVVLFAPSIAMTRLARLLGLLSWLPDRVVLPSLAPRSYRANKGTSVGAYRALSSSLRSLEKADYRHAGASPALVLVDPRDELVSTRGLRGVIERRGLKDWRLETVDRAEPEIPGRKRHMIFTKEAVGASQWARVEASMRAHLGLR